MTQEFKINLSSKKLELILSFLVATLVILPEIWAYLKTPDGHFFTGLNLFANTNDVEGVYFAAIRNFSQGDFLYRDPYNPQTAPFFHLPIYLLIGKIKQITGLSTIFLYYLFCFLLSYIYSLFIFKLLSCFYKEVGKRILVYFLLLFGGVLIYSVPEASAFHSFYFPNFIAAQLSFFASIYCLYLISKDNKLDFKKFLLLGLFSIGLTLTHPWMLILEIAVFSVWLAFLSSKKKTIIPGSVGISLVSLVALPPLLYYKLSVSWVNYPLETSIFSLPILYGLLPIAACFGIYKLAHDKKVSQNYIFLITLLIVQLAFIYMPFDFQRRFLEGMYFPMTILAVAGLDFLTDKFRALKFKRLIFANAFVYLCAGSLFSYFYLFTNAADKYAYRSRQEATAVEFLNSHAQVNQRVFSMPQSGVFIASMANVQVYAGHGIQTPDFRLKTKTIDNYLAGKLSQPERKAQLQNANICYIYIGPEEIKVLNINLEDENYLHSFFKNSKVTIYKTSWCV